VIFSEAPLNSPILSLEGYILSAAELIAPERQDELRQVTKAKSLRLKLTDQVRDISIDTHTGRVSLGLSALEHLWATALFYHCLYSDYASAQRAGQTQFRTDDCPRTRDSMLLLNWATNQWKGDSRLPWPSPLTPTANPEVLSDGHVANELFLCALAWIVHHEYAHARLSHPNRELANAPQEEQAADLAATDWIFVGAPSERHLRKRALGVIVGILALDVLEYAQQDPPSRSHPKAYERLAYCLNHYPQQEEDEAFAFALCGMQFNLRQRGLTPPLDGPSFRAILDEFFYARAMDTRPQSSREPSRPAKKRSRVRAPKESTAMKRKPKTSKAKPRAKASREPKTARRRKPAKPVRAGSQLEKVLALIKVRSGIRPSEINRRLKLPQSDAPRAALIKRGLIRKKKDGNAVRYYAV
jgi:peptidase U49-like protein